MTLPQILIVKKIFSFTVHPDRDASVPRPHPRQLNYPTDDDGGDDDDEAAAATKPRAAQTPFARVRLGRLAAPAAASAGVSRKPGEIQVGGWVWGRQA